jgi:hypothetical protein
MGAFYSFWEGREQCFVGKKGRPGIGGPPLLVGVRLEVEAQTELHTARVVRVVQVQEITRSKRRVDSVELSVVEEIEIFPAEIEAGFFCNWEFLECAKVEVETAWQIQGVTTYVTES